MRLVRETVRRVMGEILNRTFRRGRSWDTPMRYSLRGKADSEIAVADTNTPGSGTVSIWKPSDPSNPTGDWEDSGDDVEALWFGETDPVPAGVWLSLAWSWEARRYEIVVPDCEPEEE